MLKRNEIGTLGGFIFGLTGFLFVFKLVFLDNIPPEDEVAPGMVVIASVLNGSLFAFVGYSIQNYFRKKRDLSKVVES